jgi:hypothetical protein
MLKVTMLIDNKIASPMSPTLFVLNKILSKDRNFFEVVSIDVEQGEYEDLLQDKAHKDAPSNTIGDGGKK